jgi:pilus assembly protein Flp/PilA
MKKILNHARNFLRDQRGATAIEYALIAGVIGVGIIVGLRAMQVQMNGTYSDITNAMK